MPDPARPSAPGSVLGPRSSVLDGLSSLVENSLVIRDAGGAPGTDGEPRFRLIETIREYAGERLADSGEDLEVRRWHGVYFLGLAEGEFGVLRRPGGARNVARTAAELDNFRAAAEWTFAHGTAIEGLRFAAALGWLWLIRGLLREGRDRLERALQRRNEAPPGIVGHALYWSGTLASHLGDYDTAAERLQASLALYRQAGEAGAIAHPISQLGAVAEYRGDEAAAVACYEEELALARASGDRHLVGHQLSNLADAAYRAGDYSSALALDTEAMVLPREIEDTYTLATTLTGVAQAACALGDLARTGALLDEALDLSVGLDFPTGVVDALIGFADLAAAQGDYRRAARLLGTVAGWQDRIELPVVPHHAQQQRALTRTRAALGEPAWAVEFAAGRALPPDAAISESRSGSSASRLPDSPTPRLTAAARTGLRPREVEVLRLLVARRTDAEMAAALSISPQTVATHVARIRKKLGVRSRREAADLAVRDGLV